MEAAPDFLSLVEALIRIDPNPPGFGGRLALGVIDDSAPRWLHLAFEPSRVSFRRSEGPVMEDQHDCIWLVTAPEGARLPTGDDSRLQRGDTALLQRFAQRYFQTRTRLGLQLQRLQAANTSARPSPRTRKRR